MTVLAPDPILRLSARRPGAVLLALAFAGCGAGERLPPAIRLVGHFDPARVEGSRQPAQRPPPAAAVSPAVFLFDGEGREIPFQAGPGIAGLAVRDGLLQGRTTSEGGVIQLVAGEQLGAGDRLHALEVRARVSAGSTLSLRLHESDEVDLAEQSREAADGPGPFTASLTPGEELRTYTIAVDRSFQFGPLANIRSAVLHPSDAEGASFAIEWMRLVFRKEHLAGVAAGPGWQSLAEIGRETLVSRTPEAMRFRVTLPRRPWLDLAVGTVEDAPVTFAIAIERPGGERVEVARRTVTTPDRWESMPVELGPWAGDDVDLLLAAEAPAGDEAGAGRIAFWGSPVVRDRVFAGAERAAGESRPRGVILLIADTLRRDHLPMYGYERATAPSLARLGEEGAVFADAVAQGAWTKVSVPSILSSLYPTSHGILEETDRLPAAATTLSELFQAAGWATWSSSSVPFTGQLSNLHQGVEVLHERASVELPEETSSSKTARVFVDRLIPWLEEHRDGPFFVVLHLFDPHSPFAPYRPYDALWADPAKREEFEAQVEKVRPLIEDPFLRRRGLPERRELAAAGIDPDPYVAYEKAWYDGSIRAMDAEILRLVEGLERTGLGEDTLLAFVADHGEEFLEHGRHWHGQNVYGEMVNVPLLLWWPRALAAGQRIEETVQSLDLAPTLAALAGLAPPESFQGQSLVPLLARGARQGGATDENVDWRPRPAISELGSTDEDKRDEPDEAVETYAIADDGWKLVHYAFGEESLPRYQLFDRGGDPLDQHDVAAEHPEIVARLKGELERWRAWATERRLTDEELERDLEPGEIEALRSLGYVQ